MIPRATRRRPAPARPRPPAGAHFRRRGDVSHADCAAACDNAAMAQPESQQEAREVLIIVGSHPDAEIHHRPLAYALREKIVAWAAEHHDKLTVRIEPKVLTDLWYISHWDLLKQPTIAIGSPRENALSAFFASGRPEMEPDTGKDDADGTIRIDPEFVVLRVALHGKDHAATAKTVQVFIEHYLCMFMRAVACQVVPEDSE